jgi:multidrug efflux system membrane fusion protein
MFFTKSILALIEPASNKRKLSAQLKYQEAVYARNVRLMNSGQAVDVETVQQSLSQRDTIRAQVDAAKANVKQAKLNLDWTQVRAPISGLLSRTLVTRGNLVIADQTLLTSIVSLDPIYTYFDVDEQTVLRVRRLIQEGKVASERAGAVIPVYLGLADETGYPHEGRIDFVNNQVTRSTGTLQVRGSFPNPRPPVGPRLLSPGLFVRIRVLIGQPYHALLVSRDAVGADQNIKFVYLVNDQRVERRDVKLGIQQDGLQVIAAGIEPTDRVVVKGLQRIQPGAVVTPQLEPMPVPGPEGKEQSPAVIVNPPPGSPAS